MIIKKILTDASSDSKDLEKYYKKREDAVKYYKEAEDKYDPAVNLPPIYTTKSNEDGSVENRFIIIGLVLYEPKKKSPKDIIH